jgi:predicted nucleic acid-binding protein
LGKKEVARSHELEKSGFIGFDALHLACAESGKAEVFLTTDDRLLRHAKRHAKDLRIKVENPLEWIKDKLE